MSSAEIIQVVHSPWILIVQPAGSPQQEHLELPEELASKEGSEVFDLIVGPALERGLIYWQQPSTQMLLAIQLGPGTKLILMRKSDLERHLTMQRLQQGAQAGMPRPIRS